MGAVNNSIVANFILDQANLTFRTFMIDRWYTVLVTYAVAVCSLLVNIFAPHLLNRLSRSILIWNIASFIILVVALLATNNTKQPASFVFRDFQNFTGFGQAMATIIGILQSLFGMCCYDAPSHMTEEMKYSSRDAPRAMILSVAMGSVTGFIFLLVLCFRIEDISNTAASSTGVPVLQIFYESTGSKVGACVMASMITVIGLVCAVSLLAEGSRSLLAFTRDHGLPLSGALSRVTTKRHIRLNAIFATIVVQVAFNSIYFGTVTGFNTIVSIATIATAGFCPFSLPLSLSLLLNTIGLLFLLFAFVTFNFPSTAPVDDQNMNYTSAAIGVIALLAVATWFFSARRRFCGPVVGRVCEGGAGSERDVVGNGLRDGRDERGENKGHGDGKVEKGTGISTV
ncbi:amino acid/polyamine transporter I [Aspergillus undulatus]|uniref:amino acid/polyamine transporter I n=1 Tax=Aspergillus undulatus TaxID=1810928 RepID=UPI003CCDF62F